MDKNIKTIKITQVRGLIHRPERQKRTIKALNLGRIHKSVTLLATPAIQGMVHKVHHLVTVEEIS